MKDRKVKVDQHVKLYLNDKGEIIDSTDALVETENPCNNLIKFCCTSTVPDGFVLDLNIANLALCFDFSQLSCCLETQTTTCEVPDPCDGTITCPVDIQAVRLVGCARMIANAGDVTPISSPFPFTCSICCDTTTCVNQIIGFTCGKTSPCEPCFQIPGGAVGFTVKTDDCGRQVLAVDVELSVVFVGCNC